MVIQQDELVLIRKIFSAFVWLFKNLAGQTHLLPSNLQTILKAILVALNNDDHFKTPIIYEAGDFQSSFLDNLLLCLLRVDV